MKKILGFQKIYFVLLIIIGITRILQYITFFRVPFLRLINKDIFDNSFDINLLRNLSYEFVKLFGLISFVCLWIGIVISIKNKSIQINRYISIFIYYSFSSFLFVLISILLSSNLNLKLNPFMVIDLMFFISTILFYGFRADEIKEMKSNFVIVSKKKRLANYLIDSLVFFVLFIFNTFRVSQDGRADFEYLFFINTKIIYLYLFFKFVYYFSNEFLFQTTIGKIHNKSIVMVKNRFKDILFRTLARFIPFEPFTFLFKEDGLHDKLSNTQVTIANN